MKPSKKSGLSASHLKWIAIITMLIDHISATLLELGLLPQIANAVLAGNSYDYLPADYHLWYNFNEVLRMVGCLAFPIFCFLLVEGFLHTKSVKNYALRLFLFAIPSEVPFDLALHNNIFDLKYQNVFFTLLIGLLVLWGLQYFEVTLTPSLAPLRYLVPAIGILIAQFLRTDYGGFGVLLIVVLYELRNTRKWQSIFGAILSLFSSFTAPLAFIFTNSYNEEHGKQMPKYFFYAFYPLHLLLLFFLRTILL